MPAAPGVAHAQQGAGPEPDAAFASFWTNTEAIICVAALTLAIHWLTRSLLAPDRRYRRTIVIAGAWILFAAACALPAIEGAGSTVHMGFGNKSSGTVYGFVALIIGWIPPFTIPWFANVVFIVGTIALAVQAFRAAAGCGATAAILAATTWLYIPFGMFFRVLPGYVLWQTALIALLLGARRLGEVGDLPSEVIAGREHLERERRPAPGS
ncbi:MAG: hypothetical protein WD066_17420 [Planctomycetaceae bacterium]